MVSRHSLRSVKGQRPSVVPSLQEYCEKTIMRLVNLRNVLPLLELSEQVRHRMAHCRVGDHASLDCKPVSLLWRAQYKYVFPDAPGLQRRCKNFIVNCFDTLCEEEGVQHVQEALPPEL